MALETLQDYNDYDLFSPNTPNGGGLDEQDEEWLIRIKVCEEVRRKCEEERHIEKKLEEGQNNTPNSDTPKSDETG